MPSGPEIQYITKLQAARRQLVTALNLFFDDREPVSVHTLAHAAWEITSSLCEHEGIDTFVERAADISGEPVKQIRGKATQFKNFFKHADRDPGATLDEFGDRWNDPLLIAATMDLQLLCNGKLPIEVRTFQLWYFAVNPDHVPPALLDNRYGIADGVKANFSNLHRRDREEQKRRGRKRLAQFLADPAILNDQTTDRSQLCYWS